MGREAKALKLSKDFTDFTLRPQRTIRRTGCQHVAVDIPEQGALESVLGFQVLPLVGVGYEKPAGAFAPSILLLHNLLDFVVTDANGPHLGFTGLGQGLTLGQCPHGSQDCIGA